MAKMWAVVEYAWEYDDSTYSQPEGQPYSVQKVYRNEEKAIIACYRANQEFKKNRDPDMEDHEGHPITEIYTVMEVEVEDEEIVK